MWDFVSLPNHFFIQHPFNRYLPSAFFMQVLNKYSVVFRSHWLFLPPWDPTGGMGNHSHR